MPRLRRRPPVSDRMTVDKYSVQLSCKKITSHRASFWACGERENKSQTSAGFPLPRGRKAVPVRGARHTGGKRSCRLPRAVRGVVARGPDLEEVISRAWLQLITFWLWGTASPPADTPAGCDNRGVRDPVGASVSPRGVDIFCNPRLAFGR